MKQKAIERRERGTKQANDLEPGLKLGSPEAQLCHMSEHCPQGRFLCKFYTWHNSPVCGEN